MRHHRTTLPRPVAFVFTSGGARTAAQVGMVIELLAAKIVPDMIVGSSIGALNAAALAADRDHSAAKLERTWQMIADDSMLASPSAAVIAGFSDSRASKAAAQLRAILAQSVPDVPIPDLAVPLTVVASDLRTGEAVELRTGSALDAVMAASALPVVLPPVPAGDSLLIDGGLFAGAPLGSALAAGARSIVLLDAGASAVPESSLESIRWWQVGVLSYGHLIRGQLERALRDAAAAVPVLCVSCDAGSIFDFDEPAALVTAGRHVSQAFLSRLPSRVRHPGVYGIPIGLADDPRITSLAHLS
ncbi:MAG: patatin-like phospholipase family protein [Candidatus Nanopelagicales bacterium]|nr:patatin-like phospholipase family protein [Candidatus Nanopelagicales bacterium]